MKSDKSISNSKNIIADAEDYLKKERQKNRLGLFEGDTSKLLLSALLKDKSEDPFLTNYTTQILKDFFHSLNKRNMNSVSFGYGLTGFAWAMNYLMQEGYIDPDTTDLSDFDSIIRDQFNKTEINLDFMSGNLSSVIYFLDRNSFEFELEKIVDHLISLSKKNGYPQLISRYYDKNDKPVTAEYFGLAHGYAGLLIIISKINKHGIREKDCGYLIDKIYQHLLTTRVNNKNGRFPIFLCKTHTPDKAFKESFSWCHGDFGIGYALYLSGRLIGNSEYQKLGLGIIDEILEQDDKFEAQLSSPFFCHGKIGIVHMYNRLHSFTKDAKYKNAALKWYNRIDYKETMKKRKTSFPENGLLLGYEGFLLSSLSFKTDLEPKWDKSLLLS